MLSEASCPWLQVKGPLVDIMDEGGWGGDKPIWPRQLGPQLEGQTVTVDSPHSTRLQRWMDGWLEGEEGSTGEKRSRGGGERDEKSFPVYQRCSYFAFLQQWNWGRIRECNLSLWSRDLQSLAGVMGKLVFNSWHWLFCSWINNLCALNCICTHESMICVLTEYNLKHYCAVYL